MKRLTFLALIALILAACSAQPEPAANQEALTTPVVLLPEGEPTQIKLLLTSDYLNTEFEDAASLKNQLAYGTLLLEETEFAVTTDQAQILLPLYQAMVALTGDNNSVSEELNAVQNQVLESMTPEQSQKIAELQITNTQLSAFYLEKGVSMPSVDADSTRVPGSGSSMGKNLDQASREATRTAMGLTETGIGSGEGQGTGQQGRTLLFDEVIKLLTERIGE